MDPLGSEVCCHGDALIEEFRRSFPDAHDRNDLKSKPPPSSMLDFTARLRWEPDTESDSSPDEGVPGKHLGVLRYRRADVCWSRIHYARNVRRAVAGVSGKVAARVSKVPDERLLGSSGENVSDV